MGAGSGRRERYAPFPFRRLSEFLISSDPRAASLCSALPGYRVLVDLVGMWMLKH